MMRLGRAPCCYCFTEPHPAGGVAAAVRLRLLPPARAANTSSEPAARLRAVLEQVDEELRKGNDEAALSLVRGSQGADGGLRFFGAARQVPQRLYTLDELKLNGIDTSAFLSPVDLTLGSIERNLQIAAVLGGLSVSAAFELSKLQVLFLFLGLLSLWSVDLVYFGGGVRNLILDTIGHNLSQKYRNRVIQHEAGHFLIAYLLGVLPKGYTITSLDTFIKKGSLNVQAGTAFVDFEFLQEMLNKFSCIALAGVATEYLLYGYAEGGLADIGQLDGLLKGLGFTQKKADSQVRWAVLNTVPALRRHKKARSQLAEAMSSGKSVGSCIGVIEENINSEDI
ncbi:uncharacterized protein [Oryza sativa Japonica Group]|uniref:Peptidase M41 domain-containing protein n=1 Tax=Oryza rufipogon TaxID=4529 RepID=A0A0E0MWK7_ORYRU|nr:uncharacterized protein LOC4325426 isoform X2 [Oryza sativa Japonica Group]KAF2950247.1 hypothetical protein DAI22_01g175500 [Oryza sativa Japonica Group]